jgi:hypothetical protein
LGKGLGGFYKVFIFLILMLLPLRGECGNWDYIEYGLYAGSVAALGCDLIATHRMLEQGNYELNPVLGRDPSDAKLVRYFIGGSVVRYIIADLLPKDWRKAFLSSGIVFNLTMTWHDRKLNK